MTNQYVMGGEVSIDTSTSGYSIKRTMPDELIRHDISDEELDMLCDGRKDSAWEAMWVALGLSCGALPGSISAVMFYLDKQEITAVNLVTLLICVAAIVLSLALFLICQGRSGISRSLKARIRGRTSRV